MTSGRDGRRSGDPAAAFEALRAEVAALRRQVTAVESRTVDYTPTLRDIAGRLEAIGERPWMKLDEEGLAVGLSRATVELRAHGATMRRWLDERWRVPFALIAGLALGVLFTIGLDSLYGMFRDRPHPVVAGNADKIAWCQAEAEKAGQPVQCMVVVGP